MSGHRRVILSGSILDADFTILGEQVKEAIDSGLDMIHYDIIDGVFAPNISFGINVVKSLEKIVKVSSEAHLMTIRPEIFIEQFAKLSSVEIIYFHYEVTNVHYRHISLIKSFGKKAGIAINPSTDVRLLDNLLNELDAVLVLLVEPGFGGQKMMKSILNKVRYLAAIREKEKLDFKIAVDGGIKAHNVKEVVKAGADIVVVGSGIFKQSSISRAVKELKQNISNALSEN